MDFTKKMVLLPSELAETIQASTLRGNPTRKALSELDASMQDVLNRENLSDEQKITLYNQILQKYLQLQQHNPSSQPMTVNITDHVADKYNTAHGGDKIIEEDKSDMKPEVKQTDVNHKENTLKMLPVTLRKRASVLIDHLSNYGQAGATLYNDRNELIYNGHVIPGSNVVDLLYDVKKVEKHPLQLDGNNFSMF